MKKSKAIQILNQTIADINNPDFSYKLWKSKLIQQLKRIFIITYEAKIIDIEGIKFENELSINYFEVQKESIEIGKRQAKEYILSYIDEINTFGIENQRINNLDILQNLAKNTLFWTLVIAFLAGSFSLGLYFGINRFDYEKNQLFFQNKEFESEIKIQRDSIKMLNELNDIYLDSIATIINNNNK